MLMDSIFFTTPVKDEKDDLEGNPVWLPDAPVVPKPRASYNAASLAYLGDSIYEVILQLSFNVMKASTNKPFLLM
jgi:hypothetical protein